MARGLRKWSKTAATNASADSGINWAEGMAPSAVNDSARAEMASMSMWRDDNNGSLAGTLSTATYSVTSNETFDALAAGDTIAFQLGSDMPATALLNVDTLGAKPLRAIPGAEFAGGEYKANQVIRAAYFTSNSGEWIVIGHREPGSEPNSIITANITNAAVTYAKIQNVAATRLLGNATGSAAAPAEIPVSGNLFFNGTSLIGGTPRGYIDGLTFSQGSTTTLGIAAGVCRDATNAFDITLASAYTKSTASWAVGSTNGGLDTGSIANSTWYYVYAIFRSDTGVSDVIFTVTFGSPTMPTSYTNKRYIGAFLTDGSSHVPIIIQNGDWFETATTVVSAANPVAVPDSSSHLVTVNVPPGLKVLARLRLNATASIFLRVYDPAKTDETASITTANVPTPTNGSTLDVWTNTSAQIKYQASSATGNLYISTIGYMDQRGKNA